MSDIELDDAIGKHFKKKSGRQSLVLISSMIASGVGIHFAPSPSSTAAMEAARAASDSVSVIGAKVDSISGALVNMDKHVAVAITRLTEDSKEQDSSIKDHEMRLRSVEARR